MIHKIRKIVENPILQLIAGTMLLVSVLTETLTFKHGVAGILILHIIQSFLQAVPNALQALERIGRWTTKK